MEFEINNTLEKKLRRIAALEGISPEDAIVKSILLQAYISDITAQGGEIIVRRATSQGKFLTKLEV